MKNYEITNTRALIAVFNIGRLQISSYPVLLDPNNVPQNDTLVLKKAGIAPGDIINATYHAISSNNSDVLASLPFQQFLMTALAVGEVISVQTRQVDD